MDDGDDDDGAARVHRTGDRHLGDRDEDAREGGEPGSCSLDPRHSTRFARHRPRGAPLGDAALGCGGHIHGDCCCVFLLERNRFRPRRPSPRSPVGCVCVWACARCSYSRDVATTDQLVGGGGARALQPTAQPTLQHLTRPTHIETGWWGVGRCACVHSI